MIYTRPVWVEVDLDAIAHNMREIRKITSPQSKILAVVKADAYGHGAYQVALTALANGADSLAVALLQEAVELREKGITAPILILGFTPQEQADLVVQTEAIQTIFSYQAALALEEAAAKIGTKAKVHVKLDTGMGRIGFKSSEIVAQLQKILTLPHLEVEGMFTHFAIADERDKTYTQQQFSTFMTVVDNLQKIGLRLPIYHVCNSAAIIDLPEMHLDMVRPGIILYGLYPSQAVKKEKIKLKPALSLKAKIAQVKDVPAGTSISYGRKYIAPDWRKIATLPIGYADGLTRLLFAKGEVLVGGQRVPLVGRVCMDQCMIDVTTVQDVAAGDEAVLLGKQENQFISAEEIADKIGTINYEVVCMFDKRIPRAYRQEGKFEYHLV